LLSRKPSNSNRVNLFQVFSYNVDFQSNQVTAHGDATFKISLSSCRFLGFFIYFSGISMFCWMSVMCYDLYLTFGRSKLRSVVNQQGNIHFCIYTAFGFGVALIMTLTLIVIDALQLGRFQTGKFKIIVTLARIFKYLYKFKWSFR
jgi:hypothetical protein